MESNRRLVWPCLSLLCCIITLITCLISSCYGYDRLDGRYSFSLTTFDPLGKLGQVERATRAATLGTPVVAICRGDGIVMACPRVFPSPFMIDDGTSRFVRISQNIVVTHSGMGADGRVVSAAAQRTAVEHAYTFDEPMPIESFLEEVSLLIQEYTMKPGSRPFGCSLLVAYVPSPDEVDTSCRLYRIDPSGSVESMGSHGVIGSLQNKSSLAKALDNLVKDDGSRTGEDQAELVRILRDSIGKTSEISTGKNEPRVSYLTASVTQEKGLIISRA